MDICLIEENQTQTDCSRLFEPIHPTFTIIQACIALIFILLAVPLNLVLAVAIIKFRRYMDEAFILCVNIFVANVVMSFSFGLNMFMSSVTRSWPLGYIGCQVFGFFSFYPTMVRWVALGTMSMDRFGRVFLPYFYTRCTAVVISILFIIPWVAALPFNILSFVKVYSKYDMSILFPACQYQFHCNGSALCMTLTHANMILVLASGSVLPIAIYTVLYIKSRKMFRVTQSLHVFSAQEITENERQKMATRTFSIMVIIFTCYSAAGFFLMSLQVIPIIKHMNGLHFFVFDLILTYNIADFLVIWKNKDGKRAIKKLINAIARKQIFGNDAVVSAPPPRQPTTSNFAPVTASGRQHCQANMGTPAPVPTSCHQTRPCSSNPAPVCASNRKQPSTAIPTTILLSGRKQLKIVPTASSDKAEPGNSVPSSPIHAWN